MKKIMLKLFGEADSDRLETENRLLRETQFRQIEYIRKKTNQLLMLMGTLPTRPEELDDDALIANDPIGVIAESFVQILGHEKKLNERLRVAYDETQAILASVGIGIIVLDCKMNIQLHNQRMLEMFELDQAVLSGKTCCQAFCGSESYPPDCVFERIMATRRPVHKIDWIHNGKHFEVSGVPVKNRFGDVTQVVLAYTDITRRIESERYLREKEQMYLDAFENADDIVQCVATDGSFAFANRAWRDHLGYASDEIARLNIEDILAPDSRTAGMESFNRLLDGKCSAELETVFYSKDCKELPVKGRVTISYSNGKPLAALGMFRPLPANKGQAFGK